jgi:uncharacterized protein YndB with AHSA1/START domain
MKKLQFKTTINAPAEKVYEAMLGLTDKSTYEHWTSAFNPSTFEEVGTRKQNLFLGTDENGKRRNGF